MKNNVEKIRDIAKIGFVSNKPFEALPINNRIRDLVKAFKSDLKSNSKSY